MPAEVPPDAIVIRFRPTDPETVLKRAERDSRRSGTWRSSVFADVQRGGETEQDAIARLLTVSELAGVSIDNNPRYFVCVRAEELLRRGFAFVKDGDDDELPEHFSVDFGSEPTVEDARRFVEAFDHGRRRET